MAIPRALLPAIALMISACGQAPAPTVDPAAEATRIMELEAEKLDIPVLQLRGKQYDPTWADEATLSAQLEEFAQMLLMQKGIA